MTLQGKLLPLIRGSMVALLACAGFATAAQTEMSRRTSVSDIASLASMQPGAIAHPYSFADLFNLTLGAQHGLVTGTSANFAGAARGDWTVSTSVTPALFGGVNVPGLAHGLSGPGGSSMIGIPPGPGSASGDHGLRRSGGATPRFEAAKRFLPLGELPEPAGWLILASGLLVAFFIARRRAGGDGT
jgi:hypothetical protein